MREPDLKTLQDFARLRDETVVSFFLPTEVKGPETRKSPIRFKNLLKQAVDQLEKSDAPAELVRRLEETCDPLVDDHEFWQKQTPGLAVFCDSAACTLTHLPFAPEQGVYIGRRFHVKPLMRLVNRDRPFYLLAFSANRCRFFRGDRSEIEEVKLPDLPSSLEEALRMDDPEKSLQFHTESTSPGGDRPAMFHGQGAATDDPQDQMRRYVRLVADAVTEDLKPLESAKGEPPPLLLATVDESVPLYAEANGYKGLVEDRWVAGNPDKLPEDDLHSKAWPIVMKILEEREQQLLRDFSDLLAAGKASTKLEEISPAIRRGQVRAVFVAEDRVRPGTVDPTSGEVQLSENGNSDPDVLNDLAAETLLLGGEPYVMPAERLPGGGEAAAIFRF